MCQVILRDSYNHHCPLGLRALLALGGGFGGEAMMFPSVKHRLDEQNPFKSRPLRIYALVNFGAEGIPQNQHEK